MRRRATFINRINTTSTLLDGLVSYYAMEEGSGSTLVDSSGNGNDGTLQQTVDVTWPSGKVGLALSLPGSLSRYAIVPNSSSLNVTTGITMSTWIKRSSLLNNVIMIKGDSVYEFTVLSTGKIEFRLNRNTDAASYSLLSITSYPTDGTTWMHVTATFDGTTSKIYINGIEDNSATYTPFSINTNALDLYIGAWINGNNRWNGQFDEMGLWNRSLSLLEVSDLYNSGAGTTHPF